MTTTISDGVTTVAPLVVDGYESTRAPRTIVHEVLNNPNPSVSLKPAGLRTGTLSAVFATRADAVECEAMLAAAAVLTLTSTVDVGMTFVVHEDITVTLDDSTRAVWLVSFGYQEVLT